MIMTATTAKKRTERAEKILTWLKTNYPDAGMILNFSNNWELLVAVILSAQCTDKKVNEVTAKLFQKYKTLEDYIAADPQEFEQDIFSTGFYKNKTKSILAAACVVKEQFGGEIPRTMEEMLQIPGVARKTANVVLGNAYGVVEGIAVDTHVSRLAYILRLTNEKSPEKIEQDLMKLIPREDWFHATYLFIAYGRDYPRVRTRKDQNHPLAYFQ